MKLAAAGLFLFVATALSGCGASQPAGLTNALVVPTTPCRQHSEPRAYQPPPPAPSPHRRYISKQHAIRMARQDARSEYSPAAPASAPVTARLKTYRQFVYLLNEGTAYGSVLRRAVWVVTVHARTVTTEGRRPLIYSVYTLIIDAESGQGFGYAAGCDPFA
jgi:hypothetical protein